MSTLEEVNVVVKEIEELTHDIKLSKEAKTLMNAKNFKLAREKLSRLYNRKLASTLLELVNKFEMIAAEMTGGSNGTRH